MHTNTVARILGKVENNDRFLKIALYQGDRSSKKVRKIPTAAANANESKEPLTDPTLLCCAFKKHRIYLFRYQIKNSTGHCTSALNSTVMQSCYLMISCVGILSGSIFLL